MCLCQGVDSCHWWRCGVGGFLRERSMRGQGGRGVLETSLACRGVCKLEGTRGGMMGQGARTGVRHKQQHEGTRLAGWLQPFKLLGTQACQTLSIDMRMCVLPKGAQRRVPKREQRTGSHLALVDRSGMENTHVWMQFSGLHNCGTQAAAACP